ARARVAGDLEQDALAEQEAHTRRHRRPVDALQGEVLPDVTGLDGVSLGPERADGFEGEETDRALGAAMVTEVALGVTGHAGRRDLGGFDGALGHTAGRHTDLDDAPGAHQSATSVPIFNATARS